MSTSNCFLYHPLHPGHTLTWAALHARLPTSSIPIPPSNMKVNKQQLPNSQVRLCNVRNQHAPDDLSPPPLSMSDPQTTRRMIFKRPSIAIFHSLLSSLRKSSTSCYYIISYSTSSIAQETASRIWNSRLRRADRPGDPTAVAVLVNSELQPQKVPTPARREAS